MGSLTRAPRTARASGAEWHCVLGSRDRGLVSVTRHCCGRKQVSRRRIVGSPAV